MNDNEKDLSLSEELESQNKSLKNTMNKIKVRSTRMDEYNKFLMEVDKVALRYRMNNPVVWPETFAVLRDMADLETVKSLISDVEKEYNNTLDSLKDDLMAGSSVYYFIYGTDGLGAVKGNLENLRTIRDILNHRISKAGYTN